MYVFLNEKDYQKAKDQIETLSKRKTLLIIFIFLLCLSVPAFTLTIIQTKAKQYIMHYENPGRYSSKRRIFIKEKAK